MLKTGQGIEMLRMRRKKTLNEAWSKSFEEFYKDTGTKNGECVTYISSPKIEKKKRFGSSKMH